MIDNQIKKNIISKLGIEKLPQDKIGKIMKKLEENIQRKVVLEILDLLKKEDQEEIINLIEINDDKRISSFLSEKIPVIDSLIKATAEAVVREFKISISKG